MLIISNYLFLVFQILIFNKMSIAGSVKSVVLGKGRNPQDPSIFHKLTLIAFFAWVGLGSDGLSSSCYGPAEVMMALQGHMHLGLLIALGTVITIFIISASYSQIIELFPHGGGGYLVASKLLSPGVGMVSGTALLIDYVLTITVSIAAGADALFSFLPEHYLKYKLIFACFILFLITILNMRGVKESVLPLVPVFIIFVLTHLFFILYAIFTHIFNISEVVETTTVDFGNTISQLGIFGTLFLLVHAYSMGAGTYTGIEAVSNGLPILKEPKVKTAKTTMRYMAISLSVTVFGLILAYILFKINPIEGKTLNAVLFSEITSNWGDVSAYTLITITLLSETAILFVAAQTGFLDGPRVLANMALDRWVPSRFASLSNRLVTQNGIFIMGVFALLLMIISNGSVTLLVVFYSINVFITFVLSQLGMVKHWWQVRNESLKWKSKLIVNGVGLILCTFILISVTIAKFNEGGWITIFITGTIAGFFLYIKNEYKKTGRIIKKIDDYFTDEVFQYKNREIQNEEIPEFDKNSKTAVVLVSGYSGIGIHSFFSVFKLFGNNIKNFVFVQVGIVNAGNFKGMEEIDTLKKITNESLDKYVELANKHGYWAEGVSSIGLDVEEEILKIIPSLQEKFRNIIFFGGQIVFPHDSFMSRLLHNYTVLSLQRKLYNHGIQLIILPIKIETHRITII
jgi:amino acid transporter